MHKAIFLDRDGVINEYMPSEVTYEEEFLLYPWTAEAVKKIHDAGYLAIIITNQPMIAKGFNTKEGLEKIHQKMKTLLGQKGATIDAVYYCPHHPEKGFAGEVTELKIDCTCRKPKTGLIENAVKDFDIDLSKSFFIGDSTSDAKTAENAGTKFLGVKTGLACSDGKYQISLKPPLYENLLEAVRALNPL